MPQKYGKLYYSIRHSTTSAKQIVGFYQHVTIGHKKKDSKESFED